MTDSKINEFVAFSNHLADLSSYITKKYFRQNFSEENKSNDTPVTLADKEIEEMIRKEIIETFPDHGIVGEEFDKVNPESDYQWVLDPIDGTVSFIIGRPTFGTLISLAYKKKPLIGVINQPITNERWIGLAGQYSKFNGEIIKTSKRTNISEAVLCTTSPSYFKGKELEIFNNIITKTKYQTSGGAIYGGDCYLYGLLALGSVDIVIENELSNHDYMALIPIIEEAGGIITDWDGKALDLNSNGTVLACANKELHSKVLEIIKAS
ncbi:MAG: histidinol phosphate phosphatase [Proteobacteria bacterium]|nr:histidinol phosphate phosphatase [Pseudomonadota bacterium]